MLDRDDQRDIAKSDPAAGGKPGGSSGGPSGSAGSSAGASSGGSASAGASSNAGSASKASAGVSAGASAAAAGSVGKPGGGGPVGPGGSLAAAQRASSGPGAGLSAGPVGNVSQNNISQNNISRSFNNQAAISRIDSLLQSPELRGRSYGTFGPTAGGTPGGMQPGDLNRLASMNMNWDRPLVEAGSALVDKFGYDPREAYPGAAYIGRTAIGELGSGYSPVDTTAATRSMLNRLALSRSNIPGQFAGDSIMDTMKGYDANGLAGVPGTPTQAFKSATVGSPLLGQGLRSIYDAINNPEEMPGSVQTSTHYYNPDIANPKWGAKSGAPFNQFGPHTFGNPIGPGEYSPEQVAAAWAGTDPTMAKTAATGAPASWPGQSSAIPSPMDSYDPLSSVQLHPEEIAGLENDAVHRGIANAMMQSHPHLMDVVRNTPPSQNVSEIDPLTGTELPLSFSDPTRMSGIDLTGAGLSASAGVGTPANLSSKYQERVPQEEDIPNQVMQDPSSIARNPYDTNYSTRVPPMGGALPGNIAGMFSDFGVRRQPPSTTDPEVTRAPYETDIPGTPQKGAWDPWKDVGDYSTKLKSKIANSKYGQAVKTGFQNPRTVQMLAGLQSLFGGHPLMNGFGDPGQNYHYGSYGYGGNAYGQPTDSSVDQSDPGEEWLRAMRAGLRYSP